MRGVDGEGGLLVGGGVLEAGATRHHLGGIRLVHLLHGRELLRRTRLSHCLDHDLWLLRPRCRPTRTCKYHQHQTPPSPVLPHRGSVWPATAPADPDLSNVNKTSHKLRFYLFLDIKSVILETVFVASLLASKHGTEETKRNKKHQTRKNT